MRPEVISETCQVFQGKKYFLCGKYFQRDGIRLHRKVWQENFGDIPQGFHVHHIDGDRANNSPENLEAVSHHDHLSDRHSDVLRKNGQYAIQFAKEGAAEWHRSEAGRNWHREQYERYKHLLHKIVGIVCQVCGKSCEKIGRGKFCSNACKSRAARAKEDYYTQVSCLVCSTSFLRYKYGKQQQTCSKKCAASLRKDRASRQSGCVLPDCA